MKVVILVGGFGSRISEESQLKPKPMIEIGNEPILVHIMKIYAYQSFNDFIICAGYKQNVIKDYFSNFNLYTNDVTFNLNNNKSEILNKTKFNWKVTVVDTGLKTQTGGRIKKIEKYVGNERFLLTYGDGVGNINLKSVIKSHIRSKKIVTICAYNYCQNKGVIDIDCNGNVINFNEKSYSESNLINIGFMICEPEIFKYIKNDKSVFESDVLEKLAKQHKLNAYIHKGFWQCMDTIREKKLLEELYYSSNCPWKIIKKL